MDLGVFLQEVNDVPVVSCKGELDIRTAPILRKEVMDYLTVPLLAIDLDEVAFIDSTGLGVLVGIMKRMHNNGGELVLVCTQPRILEILRITGVNRTLRVFDKVEDISTKDSV